MAVNERLRRLLIGHVFPKDITDRIAALRKMFEHFATDYAQNGRPDEELLAKIDAEVESITGAMKNDRR